MGPVRLPGAYHFDGSAIRARETGGLLRGGRAEFSDGDEVEIRCAGRAILSFSVAWPWIFAAASRPWRLGAFAGAGVGGQLLISHTTREGS